jgi:PAS domain S-box-containing protein
MPAPSAADRAVSRQQFSPQVFFATGSQPLISRRFRFRIDAKGTLHAVHPEDMELLRLLRLPESQTAADLRGFIAEAMQAAERTLGPGMNFSASIEAPAPAADGSLFLDFTLRRKPAEQDAEFSYSIPISSDVLFHQAPVGYIIEDESGTILEVNDEVCHIFGYSRNEMLGMKALQLAGSENRDYVSGNITRLLGGEILNHEVLNYRKDGARLYVELREVSFPLQNGRPGILVIVKDITQRKISELRLSALQQCFLKFASNADENIRTLLETCGTQLNATYAFYSRNDNGDVDPVVHWSAVNAIALPRLEQKAMCMELANMDLDLLVRTVSTVAEGSACCCGSSGDCTMTGAPIFWNKQRVAGLCLIFPQSAVLSSEDHDFLNLVVGALAVEESRHRANLALEKSEELHRVIVELSPGGIMMVEPEGEGRIIFANRQCAALFGFEEPAEIIGRFFGDFFHDSDRQRALAQRVFLIEHEVHESVLFTLVRKDGSLFIGEVWAAVSRDEKGQIPALIVLVDDVTARVETERLLIAAKEHAEQADETKKAFILNVSHEVRAPLHIIIGYLDLLRSDLTGILQPNHVESFNSIDRAVQRMRKMVEEILNVSSMESNSFPVRYERVDLIEVTGRIVQDLSSFIQARNLKLDLVKECDEAFVEADRYCLEQTFTNLIDNAAKFTRAGSITVRLYEEDGILCCDVADTGVGIAEEFLPRIFDYFTQETSGSTRPYHGMGIGLALVKRYVELNNATITVRSRKDHGTVFTLRFPDGMVRRDTKTQGASTISSIGHSADAVEEVSRPSILLVEDDIPSQTFMKILLSKSYRLLLTSSAEEAWSIMHTHAVDLVLSDITLIGGEDGMSLIRRIKDSAAHAHIPVIMVTAHSSRDTIYESEQAGCSGYVVKPFDPNHLRELIEQTLRAV